MVWQTLEASTPLVQGYCSPDPPWTLFSSRSSSCIPAISQMLCVPIWLSCHLAGQARSASHSSHCTGRSARPNPGSDQSQPRPIAVVTIVTVLALQWLSAGPVYAAAWQVSSGASQRGHHNRASKGSTVALHCSNDSFPRWIGRSSLAYSDLLLFLIL